MEILIGILIVVLILWRLYKTLLMLTRLRFWIGLLLNGLFVWLAYTLFFDDTPIQLNTELHPIFIVIGIFLLFVFASRTFRMPLLFCLSIVTLGLFMFGFDFDGDNDVYATDDPGVHHVEPHYVQGYERVDGTEVNGYMRDGVDGTGYLRSNPNGITSDNLKS